MKKMMIGLLCLIGVMSCEVPQSITVKGNPGVYLPLGTPFGESDNPDRLENRIKPEKIKETMVNDEDTHKTEIYNYVGKEVSANLQAYIIHYPLIKMKLNLEEYVKEATTIDDTPISAEISSPGSAYLTGDGPQNTEGSPLFKVSLADMSKLVQWVYGDEFGVEMEYNNNADFERYLEIKIPAFGINSYITGTPDGNKLRFVNTTPNYQFIPKPKPPYPSGDLNANREIEIFVRVTGPCSGTIAPEMVFNWKKAKIEASNTDPIEGGHAIKNDIGKFLGKGNTFEKVTGYVYVDGIDDDNAEMTLSNENKDKYFLNKEPLKKRDPLPFVPGTTITEIPVHSPSDDKYKNGIILTDLFDSNSDEARLVYEITIATWLIDSKGTDTQKTITVDMVILLPLEFKIVIPSPYLPLNYVKLELKGLFPEPGKGDLFMRTGKNNADDLLNNLNAVKITLDEYINDISDDFHLLIASDGENGEKYRKILPLIKNDSDLFWEINNVNDLPYPFSPRFEILVKRDQNKSSGTGTLKIKRHSDPKFDFFLTVEAESNINHTIDF